MKTVPMSWSPMPASKPFKLAVFAAIAAVVALPPLAHASDLSVQVGASPSLLPLAKAIGERYGVKYTGITVTIAPTTTAGAVDLELTSLAPTARGSVDHAVAVLPVVFIANHADGVSSLTAEQVRGVLSGAITNWNQIGGGNAPVKLINRAPDAGVDDLVRAKFLRGTDAATPYAVAPNAQNAIDDVKKTRGAIALVTFVEAHKAINDVSLLAYDGATPDEAHVGDGSYPLWIYEHGVTQGKASAATAKLLSLIETDRSLLEKYGMIAVSDLGPGALGKK